MAGSKGYGAPGHYEALVAWDPGPEDCRPSC